MRVYRGFISDSSRWHQFEFRENDIIITTPSKCGTTWLQTIVGSLVFGRTGFGTVSETSPWYDMLLRPEEELAAAVGAQTHRRFLKTHSPLDGLPRVAGVTYLAIVRHPLDVALSSFDHSVNQNRERTIELRQTTNEGPLPPPPQERPPEDPAEYLLWWINNDLEPNGAGPLGLADFCNQARTYWDARDDPAVHLFHYRDLWHDLDGQIRRIATVLGIEVDDDVLPEFVNAATLDSMRERSKETAPEVQLGIWKSSDQFFSRGGTRNWAELLTAADLTHFYERLDALAGDAKSWILGDDTVRPLSR